MERDQHLRALGQIGLIDAIAQPQLERAAMLEEALQVIRQLWEQMPEPKWVISMGACATSGGVFNNYALVQGVDKVVPVDVYIPGCPPRPEALIDGILKLKADIGKGLR